MKAIQGFGLAVVLLAAPVSAFAASDTQTTTPTSPTMSAPNVPSHDGNGQLGSAGNAPTSTGTTVGPGSANHGANQPPGYSKGAGENSSVGKTQ